MSNKLLNPFSSPSASVDFIHRPFAYPTPTSTVSPISRSKETDILDYETRQVWSTPISKSDHVNTSAINNSTSSTSNHKRNSPGTPSTSLLRNILHLESKSSLNSSSSSKMQQSKRDMRDELYQIVDELTASQASLVAIAKQGLVDMRDQVISDLEKELSLTWRAAAAKLNPDMVYGSKPYVQFDEEWQSRLRETKDDQMRLLIRVEDHWNLRLKESADVAMRAVAMIREYLWNVEEECEKLSDASKRAVESESLLRDILIARKDREQQQHHALSQQSHRTNPKFSGTAASVWQRSPVGSSSSSMNAVMDDPYFSLPDTVSARQMLIDEIRDLKLRLHAATSENQATASPMVEHEVEDLRRRLKISEQEREALVLLNRKLEIEVTTNMDLKKTIEDTKLAAKRVDVRAEFVESELEKMKVEAGDLRKENDDEKHKNSLLKSDLESLHREISNLQDKIAQTQRTISEMGREIVGKDQRIGELREALDAAEQATQSAIVTQREAREQKSKNNEISQQLVDKEQAMSAMTNVQKSLEVENARLQQEVQERDDKVLVLNESVAGHQAQLATLELEKTALKQEIETLKTQVFDLKKEVSQRQSTIVELEQQLTAQAMDMSKAKEESSTKMTQLQQKIDHLEGQVQLELSSKQRAEETAARRLEELEALRVEMRELHVGLSASVRRSQGLEMDTVHSLQQKNDYVDVLAKELTMLSHELSEEWGTEYHNNSSSSNHHHRNESLGSSNEGNQDKTVADLTQQVAMLRKELLKNGRKSPQKKKEEASVNDNQRQAIQHKGEEAQAEIARLNEQLKRLRSALLISERGTKQ